MYLYLYIYKITILATNHIAAVVFAQHLPLRWLDQLTSTHRETSWTLADRIGSECCETAHSSVAKLSTVGFHVLHVEHSHPLDRPHEGRGLCNPPGNPRKVRSVRPLGHFGRAIKAGVSLGLLSSRDNHVIGSGRLERNARKMRESTEKTL